MQAQIGEGLKGQELIDFLSANADNVEKMTYMRYFDKTEAEELKGELSTLSVTINDIEEEQAEVISEFKERKKPLVKRRKDVLKELKWNGTHVTENVFKMIDHEKRSVGYYDKFGKLINSRPANPDEFQLSIIQLSKAS